MMRGVARWLKTTGDDDDDDAEDENVEGIDSEEDDGEFVDGVTPRKDTTKKGKASRAAGASKRPRKKKGQDGAKGQLRMSFFVQRDSPLQGNASPGAEEATNARSADSKDAGSSTVDTNQDHLADVAVIANPIHKDPSVISIEDDSLVQLDDSTVDAPASVIDQHHQERDDDATTAAGEETAKESFTADTNSIGNTVAAAKLADGDADVAGRQAASKRKPSVDPTDVHASPANGTPLKKPRVQARTDACPSTADAATPTLMASGRPKRKAVMEAEAKGAQDVEIVDAPPPRRAPTRLKTLRRAEKTTNDCVIVDPPTPAKASSSKQRPAKNADDCVIVDPPKSATKSAKKGQASTPLFFLTTEQRDAAKRQEAALLEEQRQVEAMVKFQQDLDRRKALDVSFFAGRKVNPFFQPQKPQVVTIDDDDNPAASVRQDADVPPSTGVVWKKEPATPFPTLSHVNALPPLVLSILNDAAMMPRRARAAPDVVTIHDDDDAKSKAQLWPALRHDQDIRLQLQAPLDDVFWCAASSAPPPGPVDDVATTPQFLHWQDLFRQSPRIGGASLFVDQYAPRSSDGVVGNKHSVKWLYEWLRAWKSFRDGKSLRRVCEQYHDLFAAKTGADGTYLSDDDDDDDPSDELHRVFVVQGESGTGKTCSVYACATQLGYEVLEINAGQPRSGKHLVELAGEATQSSRVVQTVHLWDPPKPAPKKKGKKKRDDTPLSTTSLTLVLLEDVDHLFEADKGFMTALNQIAKHARCPIVLTCTDLPDNFPSTLGHVRRTFTRPLLTDFQAYLAAVVRDQPALAALQPVLALDRLFHVCDGDIRRALHLLQVHASAIGANLSTCPVQWTASAPPCPAPTATLAAAAASCDRDLLSSSYLQELEPYFPQGEDKKAQHVAELVRMEAMAESLSLCDLWATTTSSYAEPSSPDPDNHRSERRVHSEFLCERLQDVASGVRLQACRVAFRGRATSATTAATCMQHAMDAHLRHRHLGDRRRKLGQCIKNLDASLAPVKGTTVAMQGAGAVLDTIPMMSKLAYVDASTHQHKRRSTSRHGYLNKVVSDVQVVSSIQSCTRFL